MPLNSDEFAPGRRVKSDDGDSFDVLDSLSGNSGNSYLVLGDPKSGSLTLRAVGTVRDEWEARDPEEVEQEREQEREQQERDRETPASTTTQPVPATPQGQDQASVTDAPGVTDTPDTQPTSPDDTPAQA